MPIIGLNIFGPEQMQVNDGEHVGFMPNRRLAKNPDFTQ